MRYLATLNPSDVSATPMSVDKYYERQASRAVLLNSKDEVYLVYMRTRQYYKLPGGGIKEGESKEAALHRELLEECGTDSDIMGDIGIVEEFRDDVGMHQLSYCYIAKQKGDQKPSSYEESEKRDGAEIFIAKSLQEAIQLVEESIPKDDECRFMIKRDGIILRAAAKLLGVGFKEKAKIAV